MKGAYLVEDVREAIAVDFGVCTNPQVAARLVLSVRTVSSHLEHIYGRLGIGSRTALARSMTDRNG